MSQPTSRRSFLFGRTSGKKDAWLEFLARIRRSCQGNLNMVARASAPLAHLEPARLEDVFHARALCEEFGVCMALDGLAVPQADSSRPVLQVQAGRAWGSLMPLDEGVWRVEAGCPVEVMRAAGLGVAPVTSAQNLAQWLAMLQTPVGAGGLEQYGVQALECLLADGSMEVFGEFGVADQQPLRSLAAQRTIPTLFELAQDPALEPVRQAIAQEQGVCWPLTYRLDALLPSPGGTINLAHMLLGHRGSLVWVVAAHMRAARAREEVYDTVSHEGFVRERLFPPALRKSLQQRVKQAFDRTNLFLSCQDQTV